MYNFYSRPCGRGDLRRRLHLAERYPISTHAPAGGATCIFLRSVHKSPYFYSRPCGRGDLTLFETRPMTDKFLLTPLREGRPMPTICVSKVFLISTHAPAGGATAHAPSAISMAFVFLLTPLREGRRPFGHKKIRLCVLFLLTPLREGRPGSSTPRAARPNFYSRPCGRGDDLRPDAGADDIDFYSRPCGRGDEHRVCHNGNFQHFYSRPCGRGDQRAGARRRRYPRPISTHAPAGGATVVAASVTEIFAVFLLTPLREGRP